MHLFIQRHSQVSTVFFKGIYNSIQCRALRAAHIQLYYVVRGSLVPRLVRGWGQEPGNEAM